MTVRRRMTPSEIRAFGSAAAHEPTLRIESVPIIVPSRKTGKNGRPLPPVAVSVARIRFAEAAHDRGL